jgi:hypothetical protein
MSERVTENAAEAENLAALRQSVAEAASVGDSLWLSYIVAFYSIGFLAASVTHRDLLFGKSVSFPILNVELPLALFFVVAPVVLLVSHAYLVVHLAMVGKKARLFDEALVARVDDHPTREGLRWQLPSNVLVQFLVGPLEMRAGAFGFIFYSIVLTTIVLGPIVLLLYLQVQFLPYHHEQITWLHRLAVLLDVGLLWTFWPAVVDRPGELTDTLIGTFWRHKVLVVLSIVALWFSFLMATFPGEKLHALLRPATSDSATPVMVVPGFLRFSELYDSLFNGPIECWHGGRQSPFSATLVLTDARVAIASPRDAGATNSLRGRNLEGAILNGTFLQNVDLTGADLKNASLERADLTDANLNKADLTGAWLVRANLEGATLYKTRLDGAVLVGLTPKDYWKNKDAAIDGITTEGERGQFDSACGDEPKSAGAKP